MATETQNTVTLVAGQYTQICTGAGWMISCEAGECTVIVSAAQPAANTNAETKGIKLRGALPKDVLVSNVGGTAWGKAVGNSQFAKVSPTTW